MNGPLLNSMPVLPFVRQAAPLPQLYAPRAQPGPTGLAALLARPGLRDALLATGSALMAQSGQQGTLGSALGRALPVGFQAFQQGQQQAETDALIASAPPEMQRLLKSLPGPQRGAALLSLLKPQKSEAKVVGKSLVDPDSGKAIFTEAPDAPSPTGKEREFAFYQSLTPEQKKLYGEMEAAGKGPMVTVNTGSGEINKLPVAVQSGIVGAQTVRDALDRFEGYAKDWYKLPASSRAKGQVGVPDANRDMALGNLKSVRQEVLLNIKNLAELGVLGGPDVGIVDNMMGDPTSTEALYRSPDYMLTRISRVRDFIDSKVKAYEATYHVKVPGAAHAPANAAVVASDPLGLR